MRTRPGINPAVLVLVGLISLAVLLVIVLAYLVGHVIATTAGLGGIALLVLAVMFGDNA